MMDDLQETNAAFDLWIRGEAEDNCAELDRVKKILPLILMECCTEKQRTYITHYFADRMDTVEIAKLYCVNRSTVSRAIHAGLDKAYRYLRFCSPLFINAQKNKAILRNGRKCKKKTKERPHCGD